MKIKIIQIGNSKGIVIPKHLLAKASLDNHSVLDIAIENGAIVLKNHPNPLELDGERLLRK